jgi:tRNA (mo5U34)-methyltransferase
MDLGHGVHTRGISGNTGKAAARLQLPSLKGRTVLDVGAWDGYYSFLAEREGAARVVAVDQDPWGGLGSKAGFELAREVYGSSVEDRALDVLDISPASVGRFDVVLMLGVLYHLPNPVLALERLFAVTDELLVIETAVDLMLVRAPAAAFYLEGSLKGDPTNWWGPNVRAVSAMLRRAGFARVDVLWVRPWWVRLAHWPATIVRWRRFYGPVTALHRGRAVFHAYR